VTADSKNKFILSSAQQQFVVIMSTAQPTVPGKYSVVAESKAWKVRVYRQNGQESCWERIKVVTGNDKEVCLSASIQVGCIVIPAVRIRLQLTPMNDGSNKEKCHVSLRRRHECILVESTSNRIPVVCLRFENQEACMDFTDHLLEWNPPEAVQRQVDMSEADASHVSGETLAYLVRLVQDDAFMEFTRNLESQLETEVEGKSLVDLLLTERDGDQH
jgi:hypothetical protein